MEIDKLIIDYQKKFMDTFEQFEPEGKEIAYNVGVLSMYNDAKTLEEACAASIVFSQVASPSNLIVSIGSLTDLDMDGLGNEQLNYVVAVLGYQIGDVALSEAYVNKILSSKMEELNYDFVKMRGTEGLALAYGMSAQINANLGDESSTLEQWYKAVMADVTAFSAKAGYTFYGEKDDWERAHHFAKLANEVEDNADTLYLVANCLMAQGKDQEAEGVLLSALKLEPKHKDSIGSLAMVKFSREDYSGALEQLEVLLEESRSDETVNEMYMMCLSALGRKTELKEMNDDILNSGQGGPLSHAINSVYLEEEGDFEGASRDRDITFILLNKKFEEMFPTIEYSHLVKVDMVSVAEKFDDPQAALDLIGKYIRKDGHFYSVNGTKRSSISKINSDLQGTLPVGKVLPLAALEEMVSDLGVSSTNFARGAKKPSLDDYDKE
jgi:tetratricopeptide (TPR) repeat protein